MCIRDSARLTEINPAGLRRQISAIQATLIELARRRGKVEQRPKANATYLSRRKMTTPKRATTDESTTHNTRAS